MKTAAISLFSQISTYIEQSTWGPSKVIHTERMEKGAELMC